jgi:pimeloyl-ACP methyl ester carboxylesterase
MGQQADSGYAPGDATDIYWEARGSGGTPLVLVHGGFGLASMFDDVAGQLASSRRVIAIELRGHGHSPDNDARFTWDSLAADIAGVIRHLAGEGSGERQADLLGLSLGGVASLRCAIRYPQLVRRLIVVAAPCQRDGWHPEVRAGFDAMSSATMADMLRQSPAYEQYAKVAPDPDAFSALIDKSADLMCQPYDWSDDVRELPMPVLLAYADADGIPPSHAAGFYALLGGGLRDAGWDGAQRPASRLAILPGTTHYDIGDSPLLPAIIEAFCA